MQLIVDHPHVLVAIVRVHLDLVRPAAARILAEHLLEVRPVLNELAVAIDDEHRVVPPPLPSAFRDRFTRRAEAVGVARRGAGRLEHAVRRPRLGSFGKRQLAALRDPDAIRRLGVHRADRPPRPPRVLYAVGSVGQRLEPVFDELVRTVLFLSSLFLQRCGSGGDERRRQNDDNGTESNTHVTLLSRFRSANGVERRLR